MLRVECSTLLSRVIVAALAPVSHNSSDPSETLVHASLDTVPDRLIHRLAHGFILARFRISARSLETADAKHDAIHDLSDKRVRLIEIERRIA